MYFFRKIFQTEMLMGPVFPLILHGSQSKNAGRPTIGTKLIFAQQQIAAHIKLPIDQNALGESETLWGIPNWMMIHAALAPYTLPGSLPFP